jgi:glutamyl-tRNA synthetase
MSDPSPSVAASKAKPVVTRFAPSPTGYLHIGGARTALFNWLYARRTGGRYLVRIEDTDRARSTPEAVQAIFDGLGWLGLLGDGEPVFQFARAGRHAEAARAAVATGRAYLCHLSADEEAALKDTAKAQGRAFRSPWRDRTDADPARPHTVRLRAPDDGVILIDDQVQGEVRIAAREIDDLVLLRTDGTPTYMLAVVVDDHDMGVTHVIRGDEHLTNAARQTAILQAFGWKVPVYAHIPLIHGADGAKLSKRHGALSVFEYRDLGYLPEALCAYLLRLGWSHGDLDIVSKEEATALFDLSGVGRGPSRLDLDKLGHVNQQFLRAADPDRICDLTLAAYAGRNTPVSPQGAARLRGAVPALVQRARTIVDMADEAWFAVRPRPVPLDDNAQGQLGDEQRARLARLRTALAGLGDWTDEALKTALADFAAAEGVGFGKIGPSLRAALTGGATAPELAVALRILGQEESLARLADVADATPAAAERV